MKGGTGGLTERRMSCMSSTPLPHSSYLHSTHHNQPPITPLPHHSPSPSSPSRLHITTYQEPRRPPHNADPVHTSASHTVPTEMPP